MKKCLVVIGLCMMLGANAFAQSNAQAMRFLMVSAMLQYGQKLYERGDYDEATAVFCHVLKYDDKQRQALEYLKDMGRSPLSNNTIEQDHVIVKSADFMDSGSLKQAIEAQNRVLDKLRSQISRLRANIAAQSSENN